jgi:hypothetical protein
VLLDASVIARNVCDNLIFASSSRAAKIIVLAFRMGWLCRLHCRHTACVADRKTSLLARACLGLDCHEFVSTLSNA